MLSTYSARGFDTAVCNPTIYLLYGHVPLHIRVVSVMEREQGGIVRRAAWESDRLFVLHVPQPNCPRFFFLNYLLECVKNSCGD